MTKTYEELRAQLEECYERIEADKHVMYDTYVNLHNQCYTILQEELESIKHVISKTSWNGRDNDNKYYAADYVRVKTEIAKLESERYLYAFNIIGESHWEEGSFTK